MGWLAAMLALAWALAAWAATRPNFPPADLDRPTRSRVRSALDGLLRATPVAPFLALLYLASVSAHHHAPLHDALAAAAVEGVEDWNR